MSGAMEYLKYKMKNGYELRSVGHFCRQMFANSHPKQRGFRRLYLQIYVTVAFSLALVVAAAGAIFRLAMDSTPASHALEMASVVIMAALPPRDAGPEVQQRELAKLAHDLKVDLALFDAALQPIASTSDSLTPPDGTRRGWWRGDCAVS